MQEQYNPRQPLGPIRELHSQEDTPGTITINAQDQTGQWWTARVTENQYAAVSAVGRFPINLQWVPLVGY